MPEDRGSLLQPHRDAPLSTSSAGARLAGAGLGCVCVKEHQTSSGLSKQRRSSSAAVAWPSTQRTQEKEEAEGKNRVFLLPAAPPGAGGGLLPRGTLAAVCPQAQPGVPPQSCCSQALVQQGSWRRGTQVLTGPCECGRGKGHQNPSCSASAV